LVWVPIWVKVLESWELPVMMIFPILACSAGVSAGVRTRVSAEALQRHQAERDPARRR